MGAHRLSKAQGALRTVWPQAFSTARCAVETLPPGEVMWSVGGWRSQISGRPFGLMRKSPAEWANESAPYGKHSSNCPRSGGKKARQLRQIVGSRDAAAQDRTTAGEIGLYANTRKTSVPPW